MMKKEQLSKAEPIFVKFDPIQSRIVFKSRAFNCECDKIVLDPTQEYRLVVHLQYKKQIVEVEHVEHEKEKFEYLTKIERTT